MGILGVDTVAVVVADRRRALAWYRDVLGLEVAYVGPLESEDDLDGANAESDPGHWIEMGPRRPRTRLHLCEMEGKTEPGPTGITLLTEDIQREYERLRDRGVRFRSAPEEMSWGEWLCEFEDPDGNRFDLKEPLDPSRWRA